MDTRTHGRTKKPRSPDRPPLRARAPARSKKCIPVRVAVSPPHLTPISYLTVGFGGACFFHTSTGKVALRALRRAHFREFHMKRDSICAVRGFCSFKHNVTFLRRVCGILLVLGPFLQLSSRINLEHCFKVQKVMPDGGFEAFPF